MDADVRGAGRAYGGGLALDLFQTLGQLRLGLYSGLHVLGGEPESAIVFTPLALSLAVALDAEHATFEIRIRGGGYAAALHEVGLSGGLYLGSAAFLAVHLSPRASIGLGGELHLLVAGGDQAGSARALFSPSLTLIMRPEARNPDRTSIPRDDAEVEPRAQGLDEP